MPRLKEIKKQLGKDINDEAVKVFLNHGQKFPETAKLLEDKPHLAPSKRHEIENSLEELKVFIENLNEEFVTNNEIEKKEEIQIILISILTFAKTILELEQSFLDLLLSKTEPLIDAVCTLLQSNVITYKCKNQIAIFCEKYSSDFPEVVSSKVITALLHYLLDLTLLEPREDKNVRKADIKRIWSLHKLIEKLDISDPANEVLYIRFLSTANNPNYYKCKEGLHVIGHLMSRSVNYVEKIHTDIIKTIPTISKQQAFGYGSVYFVAWSYGDENVQQAIELCIQDIINKVANISRCGFEMPKAGTNALSTLSSLNYCRQQRKFSDVLNKLYSPILWRGIQSSNSWERCNAAQIFFDIFPLEKPFHSVNSNSEYMNQQMQAIKDLLHDDSHFVRVIAIKGLCSNMTNSLELFNVNHVKDFLRILLQEMLLDNSSYHVRKAVYEGIETMLKGPSGCDENAIPSALILRPILSLLKLGFYEDNEKVRKAYFKVLLKIKERENILCLKQQGITLHTMSDYLILLSIEGPVIGEYISKLIMDDIILKNSTIDVQISNTCTLMNYSFTGLRNAFRYSKKVLKDSEAFCRIVIFIGYVRKLLKQYFDCLEEEQKCKDEDKSTDCDSSTSSASTSVRDNPEFDLLKKPKYIGGLIQIATVIWVVFRNEINSNTEYLNNLYSLASSSIPMLLKFYKGTLVYYSTVMFASLIPIAKLSPVSTVSGACISELKEITEETEEEKLQCLIYSLCSWNRGHDILELVTEWLNFAFKEQNMNNTAMPKVKGQKVPKVRFEPNEGKPLLALKLLDVLFQDVLNESRLLDKFYTQLHEFYTFLERILIIIERRFSVGGNGFNKTSQIKLSDEFLYLAFLRYLKLMHTLHKPTSNNNTDNGITHFDAGVASLNVMNWSNNVLYPHIPLQEISNADDPPLAVKCCLSVIREATLSVSLGETSEEHCLGLCVFTQDLLSLDCTWFIEDILKTIQTVSEYSQYYTPNDEWRLMQRILPSLLEKALSVLANLDTTPDLTKVIFKNNNEVKQALFSLPKILFQVFGKHNQVFIDCYRSFVFTCILLFIQEINFEGEVIAHSTMDNIHWLTAIVLKHILVTPYFINQFIPTILHYIETFSEDSMKLLSCVSILHIVTVMASKRFAKNELETAIQRLYSLLLKNKLKEINREEENEADDSFARSCSDAPIDAFRAGEPILTKLGAHLNCALINPNNSPSEKNSRVVPNQPSTNNEDNSERMSTGCISDEENP